MKARYRLGLFVGRFQPFHKGHLHALKVAALHSKHLVIGIGSSQEKGTEKNPLSSKNRIKIIRAALKGTKLSSNSIKFLDIPDFHNNEKWFNYIISKEPDLDVVFSRNSLVKRIFKSHKIAVISPEWYRRKTLIATKIRNKIRSGKRWQSHVPRNAVKAISEYESAIRNAKN